MHIGGRARGEVDLMLVMGRFGAVSGILNPPNGGLTYVKMWGPTAQQVNGGE